MTVKMTLEEMYSLPPGKYEHDIEIVSKWHPISDTERPEDDENVTVCFVPGHQIQLEAWYDAEIDCFYALHSVKAVPLKISHWKKRDPLPEENK